MQNAIICDLIEWLEKNLDQPLSLDSIAEKSGYTKWHLQRLFKTHTGQTLFSYVQARRLTRAAIALRLTRQPILDLALEYHFDSQQSFTRAFKKRFSLTPYVYRHMETWTATGITSPLISRQYSSTGPEYITRQDAPEYAGLISHGR